MGDTRRAIAKENSPVRESYINFLEELAQNALANEQKESYGAEEVIEANIQDNMGKSNSRGTTDNGISGNNGASNTHQDRDITVVTSARPVSAWLDRTWHFLPEDNMGESISSSHGASNTHQDRDITGMRALSGMSASSEISVMSGMGYALDDGSITNSSIFQYASSHEAEDKAWINTTIQDQDDLDTSSPGGPLINGFNGFTDTEDDDTVLHSNAGPASSLLGKGWDSWLDEDLDPCFGTPDSGDSMQLPREDMKIFGEFPGQDDLRLVECNNCHMHVKEEALRDHHVRRHGYVPGSTEEETKADEAEKSPKSQEDEEVDSQPDQINDQIAENAITDSNVTTDHGSIEPTPEEENKENVPEKSTKRKHKSGSPGQRALQRLMDKNSSGSRDPAPSVAASAKKRKASGDMVKENATTDSNVTTDHGSIKQSVKINTKEENKQNVPEKSAKRKHKSGSPGQQALSRLTDFNTTGNRDPFPSVAASAKKRKASGDVKITKDGKKSKVEKTTVQKLWYDGTVYKCGLCEANFKDNDSIRHHLRTGHKMKTNSKTFQDNIILFDVSLYKCKLCRAKVNRNRQTIRNHVRTSHNLTFVEYESSHEDIQQNSTNELMATGNPEDQNERIDLEGDRIYTAIFVGKKVQGNYGDAWYDGVIDYYNVSLAEYHIYFPEFSGDDDHDYVTASDIHDGVDIRIIE